MKFNSLCCLVSLAPLALAVPARHGAQVEPSPPEITAPPSVDSRQLDARDVVTSTIPVSSCINFADPDKGMGNMCQCSGYDSLIPHTTIDGLAKCSWSQYVTVVTKSAAPTTTNPFPFTTTLPNEAIVAYQSSSLIVPQAPNAYQGVGDATTLQFGTKLTVQMDPTSSVMIGALASPAQQSAFYTSVSNALDAACATPTAGETVTTCGAVAAVTNIAYVDTYRKLQHDGELKMDAAIVSYSDEASRDGLITSIAAMLLAIAQSDDNSVDVKYWGDTTTQDLYSSHYDLARITTAPAILQSIVTIQTAATNGDELLQNLQIHFTLQETNDNSFACSAVGLILSGIAAVASTVALKPKWGWVKPLSGGTAGTDIRFAVSVVCAGLDSAGI